jgi:hypothetical protein
LSIIAYKQPITQAVVVKIRGNKAYEHVKHLLQVGLIKGKKRGHTLELNLDERFYDYFNIEKRKQEEKEPDDEHNIIKETEFNELNLEDKPLIEEKRDEKIESPEYLTKEDISKEEQEEGQKEQ